MAIEFEKSNNCYVKAFELDSEGLRKPGSVMTQSVEANLSLAILEKLEEIRIVLVDIKFSDL